MTDETTTAQTAFAFHAHRRVSYRRPAGVLPAHTVNRVLQAFVDYCDRNPLERRPTVFVQFIDIWGEPKGEMGIPDIDLPELAQTCFAFLSPWALIPTLGDAWLVVDWLEDLRVTHVQVSMRGIFNPHWRVPYSMGDDGALAFGEPERIEIMPAIALGLQAAINARHKQTFWGENHTVDTIMPVVQALLADR